MKKAILLGIVLNVFLGFSQTIALQSFATGFSSPVDIANAGDTRLFVVEQGGLIKILNSDGTINATPFLNLSALTVLDGERGLLGLAFHPNYATNGLFYVNYTNLSGNTVIARYGVSANANIANSTGTILMTISQPYSNHNGGCLKFGPDGYLYIGMGDGGSAGDPNGYSQNLTVNTTEPTRVYLGKMLRIDVNTIAGSLNYGFPPTNPYVSQPGKEEIWARGLRNPWKFSFNRLNGDLWIADVGQGTVEEIDKIVNPLPTALNFGWRCYEGNSSYNTSGCAASSTMVFPFAQYTHSGGSCSITGGYFYTGTTYPNFQNKYFFTDYCDDKIRTVNSAGVITTTSAFSGNNFVTFGQDSNGELYLAGVSSGIVYKIIDSSLSTSEFNSNGFSIYPNPAKTSFTIKSNPNNLATQLELFDLTGKLLIDKKLNNVTENTITTNSLSKGIYLISITTTSGSSYTDKLIIE
ncbi:PQQ-dependent sugar dehydrogenase [Flavobacterium sp. SUN052]|uniref:PQQ-dependent sugar dehydrogenase n=1 Tax=Flavobacterium sp. SUN052 TaxID=3002441 RepID=UPI00237D770F|nr:PQQ-dependent sugar dehydrogenase [Flavobacterium sp. SUN052]MEC4003334.1 PQQ-dependent sugar dehydrogenase [Flavobacterium sp. SUN052]